MACSLARRETSLPSRILKITTLIAILFNMAMLAYFALFATVWDEEAHTFFLSSLPLSDLLDLMSHNFNEDAPGFNILFHTWQKMVSHNPFVLRLMPIIFWIAAMLGVAFLTDRIAGRRAMYWSLIITSLWPYHWIYPMAMRWYSLAGALAVWNLYFFLRLIDSQRQDVRAIPYSSLIFGALVALTGAAAWYTVYLAPAIAAGELVLLMFVGGRPLREVRAWALAWLGALILYLPWLPTFLRQLSESTEFDLSLNHIVSSTYVVWAGDFSLPTVYWISVPFFAAAVCGLLVALKYWSSCKAPILVGGVVFFLLLLFDSIEIERMMIVTVLLSAGIGIAVAMAFSDSSRKVHGQVVIAAGILTFVGLGGSFANITSGSGWLTYRWLDEVNRAADHVASNYAGTIILSNSNSLAFYIDDPMGLEISKYGLSHDVLEASDTKVWNSNIRNDGDYSLLMEKAISSHTDVTYVHHAFFNEAGSSQGLKSIINWLGDQGLEPVDQWQATPIKGGNERFLDLSDHPRYRVTVVHLRRP